MNKRINIIGLVILGVLMFSSCGEYYQVLKSNDPNARYSYAKKMYNEKKYSRVVDLMSDIISSFNGTSEGAQALYILANSYYNLDYNDDAAELFRNYYTSYPKEKRAEECQFKAGECIYRDIPDARLDQTSTYQAIKDLQLYLDAYPTGKYVNQAENMLFVLQDKLAEKDYLSAKLYYDLGLYMGNNYISCIITAKNALKEYPYTRWKEDLLFLILQAEYEQAENSIQSKFQERARTVIDQYYAYINEFPKGKYTKEAEKIYKEMNKKIKN